MRQSKSAAIITIKRASKMSPEGRRLVAKWLRRQATFLTKHGRNFSDTFRGRYLYR